MRSDVLCGPRPENRRVRRSECKTIGCLTGAIIAVQAERPWTGLFVPFAMGPGVSAAAASDDSVRSLDAGLLRRRASIRGDRAAALKALFRCAGSQRLRPPPAA